MNKQRRSAIEKLRERLSEIHDTLEEVLDEERCAFENMPEGLQESERGQAMQTAIDSLESAVSSLEEADEMLEESIQ